jgi:hypothetical protein
MLDAVSYQRNLIDARTQLTDYKMGVVGPHEPAKTKANGFGVFKVVDSDYPLELIYQLHDLYIEGWRNASGQLIIHKLSGYSVNPNRRLNYTNEYGDLGYDRNLAITVTLDTVNGALAAAYNSKLDTPQDSLKKPFYLLAIAFAEGLRFSDVMYKIIKGLPIDDVDWDKHKDKSAIMVVKS